jgi:hypothetical protein
VTTPLYLVNQMASIWDTFCNIDGVERGSAGIKGVSDPLCIFLLPSIRNF